MIADGPSPGTWTGLSGMREGWRAFLTVWDGFHAEADEYRVIDDDRVLVLDRFWGRGRQSGLEVGAMRTEGALLFCLRESLMTLLAGCVPLAQHRCQGVAWHIAGGPLSPQWLRAL